MVVAVGVTDVSFLMKVVTTACCSTQGTHLRAVGTAATGMVNANTRSASTRAFLGAEAAEVQSIGRRLAYKFKVTRERDSKLRADTDLKKLGRNMAYEICRECTTCLTQEFVGRHLERGKRPAHIPDYYRFPSTPKLHAWTRLIASRQCHCCGPPPHRKP